MSMLTSCPHCGKPVARGNEQCNFCQADFYQESAPDVSFPQPENIDLSGGIHAPHLGEFLLKNGLIGQHDLKNALALQSEQVSGTQKQLLGQILIDQGLIDQNILNEVILEQILSLQSALNSTNQPNIQPDREPEPPTNMPTGQIKSITSKAISILTQADSIEQVLEGLVETFLDAPYVSSILLPERNGMVLIHTHDQLATYDNPQSAIGQSPGWLPFSTEFLDKFINPSPPLRIFNINNATQLPSEVLDLSRQLDNTNITFIPVMGEESPVAIIMLGSRQVEDLRESNLKAYTDVANLFSKMLQSITKIDGLEGRLSAFQTLDAISQTIAIETEINKLYQVIHDQISKVLGEVNFLFALYDSHSETINIPYAYENYQPLSIPSFPLGEGLTSIIISSGQPLMFVSDVESRAQELGAKLIGAPAKSFLGIPLIVAGDVIGAMVVQDDQQEHRFNEDDLHFLSLLASQIAITVRNLLMLEEIQGKAKRDRVVSDISAKLWASSDVEIIMRTAIHELGQTLRASRGLIQLEVDGERIDAEELENV